VVLILACLDLGILGLFTFLAAVSQVWIFEWVGVLAALLPSALVLLVSLTFQQKTKFTCVACGTIWYVPMSARRAARREPAGGEADVEQTADLALTVNELLAALQEGDSATRRAAATTLRALLPQLDSLPATKAGAERALQEYERGSAPLC
jgi:hypothetical protein